MIVNSPVTALAAAKLLLCVTSHLARDLASVPACPSYQVRKQLGVVSLRVYRPTHCAGNAHFLHVSTDLIDDRSCKSKDLRNTHRPRKPLPDKMVFQVPR